MSIRFIFLLLLFTISVYAKAEQCFIDGNLHKSKGNYTEALESYMSGVDENMTNCMIEASKLYFNEEHNISYKPDLAFKLLQKALDIEPYNSLIHYNLCGYYYYLGNDTSKREAGDLKVKYHSKIAYLLGDEDALYYVNGFSKLKKKNGYIEDVLENSTFNTELIAKRIEKFSQGRVLNIKHFKISLNESEIKFYGRLDYVSAKNFGKHIRTIQEALYIDVPNAVIEKTDDILSKMMLDFSTKYMLEEEFSDILQHKFTFMRKSRVFTYRIKIAK